MKRLRKENPFVGISSPSRNLSPTAEDVPADVLARMDIRMTSERGRDTPRAYTNEAALSTGLASMEPDAWRQLFEAHYAPIYRYAYLRLGNQHDAEDIASNVFAEAVRGIGGFTYRGIPVVAWLYRIAHHETVDALKRRRPSSPLDAETADTRQLIAEAAERSDLGEALAALKQEHREVLLLRFIEDRSVRDTANALNKTEGAVKVLQLRALRALRRRLQGMNNGI